MKHAPSILALSCCLSVATAGFAALRTETIDYKQGDTTLRGYLAYDDSSKAQRPGVLVVHEWWGLNDYARMRAEKLAAEGYVAFAIDMFGEGKSTQHPQTAGEWASAVAKSPEVAIARFQAGQAVLAKHPLTAPGQIAAIGYCFGGRTVLSLAMSGADLKAVASFHGALPQEPAAGAVKAKVLVCHGAADSFITPEQIVTFEKNLVQAGADWQFVNYGGAKHSFTNPGADKVGLDGLAYNASADQRSWALLLSFLKEAFSK
jgi:dienelactone hydrolase